MDILVIGVVGLVGVLVGAGGMRALRSDPDEAKAREVELDLRDAQERIEELTSSLQRARSSADDGATRTLEQQLENLGGLVGQPLAFFAVQVSKVTSGEDSGLEAGDLAVTGQRLVAALREAGVHVAGEPGDQDCFDPTRHTPATADIEPGTPVVCLVPAIETQNGFLVRRAVVEKQ